MNITRDYVVYSTDESLLIDSKGTKYQVMEIRKRDHRVEIKVDIYGISFPMSLASFFEGIDGNWYKIGYDTKINAREIITDSMLLAYFREVMIGIDSIERLPNSH